MQQAAILEAFADLPDRRRGAGHASHSVPCLIHLGDAAGNKGFIAIGDWIRAYQGQLIDLFEVEKERLPSYSTIRRMLLNLDYRVYSECLAKFFGIEPKSGETIAVDGKVLRVPINWKLITNSESHPAIMLALTWWSEV